MPASKESRGRSRPQYSRPLTREKIAAAALYRHFRNKDELLAEVGRLASEMVDLEAPTSGRWKERSLELAERIRDRIRRHLELGIYGGRWPWATPFFARANGLIAALFCEAGFVGQQLVFATQTVLHLVTSVTQSEVMTRSTPA